MHNSALTIFCVVERDRETEKNSLSKKATTNKIYFEIFYVRIQNQVKIYK